MTETLSTLLLHGGDGPRVVGQPVSPAPVLSTAFFTHPDAVGFSAEDLKAETPHFYTRWSNPTLELLERRLALLEGGEAAVVFGSGMGAITGLFSERLGSGDHLVLSDVCYAGVAEYAHHQLPRQGVEVSFVDASDPGQVAAALRPNTRLVHVETPANPILRLTDIAAVAAIAHAGGAELSVDSTIATPVGTNPIGLGADYVCHSLTKYLCGHGDALGGAVIGTAERVAALRRQSLIHLGAALSPFSAYLILRGIETLELRMDRHEANARALAECLQAHPRVRRVNWPGLASHPQADLARRQMRNFSGLLSFSVTSGGAAMARQLADRLTTVSTAVSLGKTKSLCFFIPTEDILRSSFRLAGKAADDYRDWAGDGVFRVSVGIEAAADIIADFEQALG
ncbi:MAG: PLP-dependent transferase [Devosia sp.]|nr:PLP-dependent transferase [Devosia sp.]